MFAYIDETGNTGARLLDDAQPLFITGALLTRSDFDSRFKDEVSAIASRVGSDEIHANVLGMGRLETIASDLLKTLRKAGPTFFLARVEKRYVIASKVFDTIFDSFENKAVPWHFYNLRPLRMLMVFKLADLLDDPIAEKFWDALMDTNALRARTKMSDFCREFAARAPMIADARSQDVAAAGLAWAAQNPDALEFVHNDKRGRKGHLPNMIGFGNLLSGIEGQSAVWRRPVEVIRHDRQPEFADAIKFWHTFYAEAPADVIRLPLGEKLIPRKVFGSRLEISSAKDSAGIQMIDAILWLFNRALRGDELPTACQTLLDYVFSRARQDDFSFIGVGATMEAVIEGIERDDLPLDVLTQARALQAEIEEKRLAAIMDHEAMRRNQ